MRGDRLWVREPFKVNPQADLFAPHKPGAGVFRVTYEADKDAPAVRRWAKALAMPREFSRLTLEVVEVRRQRLQDLTEEDAQAEGVEQLCDHPHLYGEGTWRGYGGDQNDFGCPVASFESLWATLHRRPGTRWDDNPEVVAISFTRKP